MKWLKFKCDSIKQIRILRMFDIILAEAESTTVAGVWKKTVPAIEMNLWQLLNPIISA